MHIVHLTSSTQYGGPERQMLGLAAHLPTPYRSSFLSYSDGNRCQAFLEQVHAQGFSAVPLRFDTPHLRSALRELTAWLSDQSADILVTHGYKSNVLGRIAARRVGIPIVSVSRGWTWENWKVRTYERIDRFNLRFMDAVVAVSAEQARRVQRAGVRPEKITIIRNAARLKAFAEPDPRDQEVLAVYFPQPRKPSMIVMAAGRLSPEKGFDVLVEAAGRVLRDMPEVGFVVFGEGVERPRLEARIAELGLQDRFRLPGFTDRLDRLLPHADLMVLPSFTEGLPNVALEASAAGVPVVATAVGGTPEVIADGVNGSLIPPGEPNRMAEAILNYLRDPLLRISTGQAGRQRMEDEFTFAAQARAYMDLFDRVRKDSTCQRLPLRNRSEKPVRPSRSVSRSRSVSSSIT